MDNNENGQTTNKQQPTTKNKNDVEKKRKERFFLS